MPEGFGYPFNYDAWTPLPLRASYGPLEGGAISVIGRLAPGVTRAQADAEVRALGERTCRGASGDARASPAAREPDSGNQGKRTVGVSGHRAARAHEPPRRCWCWSSRA